MLAYNSNIFSFKVSKNLTSDLASIFSKCCQLPLEQCCKIAAWQEVFQSLISVQLKFEKAYGLHTAPIHQTISVHCEFLNTGSVLDKLQSRRPAITITDKNTELLEQALCKAKKSPSKELHWNSRSINSLIQRLVKFYPLPLQVVRSLQVEDYHARVEMCKSLLKHYQHNPQLLENLWLSKESIFHLSG